MKRNRVSLLLSCLFPLFFLAVFFSIVKPVLAETRTVGTPACPTTIQACINISQPGDTVFIPAGTYVESLVLNTAVTLRGQNQVNTFIQAPAGQRVLWIDGALVDSTVIVANLTLRNGDVSGSNVCFPFPTNCGGGILITGGAQPQLINLTIENNQAYQGGGLYAESGSVLHLSDLTFFNNSSVLSGGGAYVNDAVTVEDTLFEDNVSLNNVAGGLRLGGDALVLNSQFQGNETICPMATSICHGGALYGFELDLTVYDSLFEDNICNGTDCDGGGLYLGSSFVTVTLTLSNTDFVNNTAGRNGGGVLASSFRVNTVVNNGRFENNEAILGDGGGITAYRAVVTGTQFLTNTAGGTLTFSDGGGGLDVQTTAVVTNALFQGNHSNRGGGGLAAFLGPLTIENSIFDNNTVNETGGGAYVEILGADIRNSRFENNRTLTPEILNDDDVGNGGGLWANGMITLTNVDFFSNTATNRGGGVYVPFSIAELIVANGRFQGNQALGSELFGDGGGGLYYPNQPLILNNVQFFNNEALSSGGGGLMSFGVMTDTGSLFQNNNALFGGGLYALAAAQLNGTNFVGNSAVNTGGGAFTNEPTEFVDVIFLQNNSTGTGLGQGIGGGLRATEAVTLTNSQFISNTAAGTSGGGASVFAPISMTNILFQGNQSAGSGGGLSGAFDLINLNNSQFISNTAVSNGGGLQSSGNISLVDSLFQFNQSGGGGGGIFTNGTVLATNSNIFSNTAGTDGGGVNANSGINFVNGRFQGNMSSGNGGGYFGNLSQLRTNGTAFVDNHAGGDGGGADAFDGTTIMNTVFADNSAQGAGGGLRLDRFVHITTTVFTNNAAELGGGLAVSRTSSGTSRQFVINSVFARNSAGTAGAAIYYNQPRPIDLTHLTLGNTVQEPGSALFIEVGTVALTNTIISSFTTGIENVGGVVSSNASLFFGLNNNTLGVVSENNTLVGDPTFVDEAVDDFRLVVGSPGIDTGVASGESSDILGISRPLGAGFDRGAYEGDHSPTAVTLTTFSSSPTSMLPIWLLPIVLLTAVTMLTFRHKKTKNL